MIVPAPGGCLLISVRRAKGAETRDRGGSGGSEALCVHAENNDTRAGYGEADLPYLT